MHRSKLFELPYQIYLPRSKTKPYYFPLLVFLYVIESILFRKGLQMMLKITLCLTLI